MLICSPLIFAIKGFYQSFGQYAFKLAEQDDVIFSMKVYPASVAFPTISALHCASMLCIENLIQRLLMDIAQHDTQVLAQRHISICVYDQFAENAVTPQMQMTLPPFVVERDKIVILLCVMNVLRYLRHIVLHVCLQEFGSRVEKVHCAVYPDANVNSVLFSDANHKVHVLERIPRREAKHEGNLYLVSQCLHHLYHFVIAVASAHLPIGFSVAVQRHIQMRWVVRFDCINQLFRCKAVAQ